MTKVLAVFGVLLALQNLAPESLRAAADPRDTDSPYGVLDFLPWDQKWSNYQYNPEKIERAAALMEEAGIGMVRMDFIWQEVEPRQGHFKFAKYDRIIKILDAHHIKVLGLLLYNPAWRDAAWNAAPITADYVAYAKATVHHFKKHVKYWEIWNEPDSKTYWQPQDDMTAYAQLLKAVYPVIKTEDPTSKVLIGGMTEAGPYSARRVYQRIGKNYFDIMNVHPFVDPNKPGAVQTMKGIYYSLMRVMQEFDDADKPIWFTELGAPGVVTPTKQNAWWHGTSPTEAKQAEWVTSIYGNALHWKGVQKVFWAFFRDTNDFFHCGVDSFGLLRNDFSKKPAFDAYKRTAQAKRQF